MPITTTTLRPSPAHSSRCRPACRACSPMASRIFSGVGIELGDLKEPHHRLDGDHALVGPVAELYVQGRPSGRFLVLAEAERVAQRPAEAGPVEFAGNGPADVPDDQAEGAADGGIGPESRTEACLTAVNPDLLAHRAVDDDRVRRAGEGGGGRVGVGLGLQVGADGRHHHREVLGAAPCHHGIDGRFLGGHRDIARGYGPEHFVGVQPSGGQHGRDRFGGGGDHGQAVGPPELEAGLERLVGRVEGAGGGAEGHEGWVRRARTAGAISVARASASSLVHTPVGLWG